MDTNERLHFHFFTFIIIPLLIVFQLKPLFIHLFSASLYWGWNSEKKYISPLSFSVTREMWRERDFGSGKKREGTFFFPLIAASVSIAQTNVPHLGDSNWFQLFITLSPRLIRPYHRYPTSWTTLPHQDLSPNSKCPSELFSQPATLLWGSECWLGLAHPQAFRF